MQNILVTGAAGHVGSRLRKLLKDTYPRLVFSDIRMGKTIPVLGAAGLSLSLVNGASAASGPVADMLTRNTGVNHQITLCKEEISDVSLATFHVFDNENAGAFRRGVKFAGGGCGQG